MSVPRFTDEMLAPLKRVMLARAPEFVFAPEDVEVLVKETGLVKAQVQKWAVHFRERVACKSMDETLEYLRGTEKVT